MLIDKRPVIADYFVFNRLNINGLKDSELQI